jgi:hypothetical protein
MCDPKSTLQAFKPTQGTKKKRSVQPSPSEATTSFLSPNQFAVLSESESDIEEDGAPLQPKEHQARIPPIVIYSYLNNHSTILKQVDNKLSNPVDVKSKSDYFYTPNPRKITTFCSQKFVLLNSHTTHIHYQKIRSPGWY